MSRTQRAADQGLRPDDKVKNAAAHHQDDQDKEEYGLPSLHELAF
jgi:hypothetical protein